MSRMPRLYVDGCTQHIVQRGDNRSVFFVMKIMHFICRICGKIFGRDARFFDGQSVHLLRPQVPRACRLVQSLGRFYVIYAAPPASGRGFCVKQRSY